MHILGQSNTERDRFGRRSRMSAPSAIFLASGDACHVASAPRARRAWRPRQMYGTLGLKTDDTAVVYAVTAARTDYLRGAGDRDAPALLSRQDLVAAIPHGSLMFSKIDLCKLKVFVVLIQRIVLLETKSLSPHLQSSTHRHDCVTPYAVTVTSEQPAHT